jgi:hypothetical protein
MQVLSIIVAIYRAENTVETVGALRRFCRSVLPVDLFPVVWFH